MVTSIRNLAWNVGWAVGPYISGLVQQRWGFNPLFVNTAVLYGSGDRDHLAVLRPEGTAESGCCSRWMTLPEQAWQFNGQLNSFLIE